MDAELKQYLEAMEKRLKEHFQSTETKLLTAFYEWARPQEMRVNTFTQLATGFDYALGIARRAREQDGTRRQALDRLCRLCTYSKPCASTGGA